MTTTMAMNARAHMELVEKYSAHNYHPLPVVVAKAEGVWLEDADGKRYMDFLAAYSAVNFGHSNAELIEATRQQLGRVTLTSRAFQNDQFGPFCEELADLCGMEAILPMNTGAEGVETAIKAARRWGYRIKGVPAGRAKIIACDQNFHGRTTTIISFSTDTVAREDYGPYTPGFEIIPYGDIDALKKAIDDDTVAFLVEPIQGEAGIIVPPDGFLGQVRQVCSERNVLFIADEIQSGLGRTGYTLACEHDGVQPDIYILGKALGGGIMPVSAIVSSRAILSVFTPGSHGSTFGGNPLACAIGRKVIEILNRGEIQAHTRELGAYLHERLRAFNWPNVIMVRGRGLWAGLELDREKAGPARPFCERLMGEGLLCKDTHSYSIRLAPPLVITRDELDWALERLDKVLR
ncbi:MAG TPA: ornithine--oxo-acid transaminase [Phycisphaerae bacterium]|nr:ornithine--oxo-acid transaminase [Phycisphaerae bacterium]